MKLDRNINPDGRGKYALVRLRGDLTDDERYALAILQGGGRLDWGRFGEPDEFWVIKLRDKYADAGLRGYADAARQDDIEYAAEVDELVSRAGISSPFCKAPD